MLLSIGGSLPDEAGAPQEVARILQLSQDDPGVRFVIRSIASCSPSSVSKQARGEELSKCRSEIVKSYRSEKMAISSHGSLSHVPPGRSIAPLLPSAELR